MVSGGLMASLCQSRGLGSSHGPHRAQCVSVSSGSNSHTPGLSLGGQGKWSSVARAGWRWRWGCPSVCVHWLTLSPEGRGPVSAAASLADCLSCCLLGLVAPAPNCDQPKLEGKHASAVGAFWQISNRALGASFLGKGHFAWLIAEGRQGLSTVLLLRGNYFSYLLWLSEAA